MDPKTRAALLYLTETTFDLGDPKQATAFVNTRLRTLQTSLAALIEKEGFLAHEALKTLSRHEDEALAEWQHRAGTILKDLDLVAKRLGVLVSDLARKP